MRSEVQHIHTAMVYKQTWTSPDGLTDNILVDLQRYYSVIHI